MSECIRNSSAKSQPINVHQRVKEIIQTKKNHTTQINTFTDINDNNTSHTVDIMLTKHEKIPRTWSKHKENETYEVLSNKRNRSKGEHKFKKQYI